jgi:glycosyltransferase involved in cell wall biosynthesis
MLSYFNQTDVLKKHLETWSQYHDDIKQQITFQIIDDCSLKSSAFPVIKEHYDKSFDLSLYQVHDDLICNISGVRNLGATVADTEWILILDMDTIISPLLAQQIIDIINKTQPSQKIVHKFNRKMPGTNQIRPPPGICFLRKDLYWEIGGCDEDLVGSYGYTDPLFWHRCSEKRIPVKINKDLWVTYLHEGESDIKRNNSRNLQIFNQKKRTKKYSTDFVRFKWSKINLE